MKPTTTIVLLTLLALPANAQDGGRIFHDAAGRVTGSARTDANGVTTFHDRAGFVTGTARTDSNDTTTFHDASGRITGRSGDEGVNLAHCCYDDLVTCTGREEKREIAP